MHIEDYQKISTRTMPKHENIEEAISHMAIGIAGESGEISEEIKHFIWHSDFQSIEEYKKAYAHLKDKLALEIGDLTWYLVNLATVLDLDMDKVLENNINKLNKRYPNGYNAEDSIRRIDVYGENQ